MRVRRANHHKRGFIHELAVITEQTGTDQQAVFRQVATYVDKVLKGARPADLPVEQPTKLDLIVNRKTATALGRTIPQALLISASEVID